MGGGGDKVGYLLGVGCICGKGDNLRRRTVRERERVFMGKGKKKGGRGSERKVTNQK